MRAGLLDLSPELQRNLWLELTPTRLVVMPLALLIAFEAIASITSIGAAKVTAVPLLWGLLSLWGSRLAADSFGEESVGGTWDVQRLSAQSASGLVLGKLVGGTAIVWYGAACCWIMLGLLGADDIGPIFAKAILAGLTAQSAALFAVVLLHRFDIRGRRAHTTVAQIVGIVVGWNGSLFSSTSGLLDRIGNGTVDWYGSAIPADMFMTIVRLGAVVWFVIGAVRLIRRELGFQDGPLGWTLYTLYTIALVMGLGSYTSGANPLVNRLPHLATGPTLKLGLQSVVAISAFGLTYAAVLGTPVSRIALTKLRSATRTRDWIAVWRNLPIWVPSAIASIAVCIALSLRLGASAFVEPAATTPLAALGFLFRDIGIVMFVRLAYRQRTAMAILVIFVLLYGIFPAVAARPGSLLSPLFFPAGDHHPLDLLFPWIEAVAVWFAVTRRWPKPVSSA